MLLFVNISFKTILNLNLINLILIKLEYQYQKLTYRYIYICEYIFYTILTLSYFSNCEFIFLLSWKSLLIVFLCNLVTVTWNCTERLEPRFSAVCNLWTLNNHDFLMGILLTLVKMSLLLEGSYIPWEKENGNP